MSEQNPTWIADWNPEDETFWNSKGKFVARRNLIWSIVAEHIGFSVWLIWSIVATKLPQAGFHFSTDELFQLVALPGLIGSLMRFPYTFAVTTFGGRNWTIFSASVLFIPTLGARLFRQPSGDAVLADAAGGLDRRSWRRQLRLQHGQYLLLLSRPHEGLGARPQRGRRQYRSLQRAIADADPDGARHHQSLSGDAGRRRLSAERRPDVGGAARDRGVRRDLLHEQPDLGKILVQGPARHHQAQAHLDHGLHLHRDVRLLHRLLGGVPAADQDAIPGGHDRHRVPRAAGRLAGAAARRLARRQGRRRDPHLLEFHRHGGGDDRRPLLRRRTRISPASSPCS